MVSSGNDLTIAKGLHKLNVKFLHTSSCQIYSVRPIGGMALLTVDPRSPGSKEKHSPIALFFPVISPRLHLLTANP